MKIRRDRVFDDRPHPGPLPQERESRPPSHMASRDWIGRTAIGKNSDPRLLFPLAGGEGQGEGERNH